MYAIIGLVNNHNTMVLVIPCYRKNAPWIFVRNPYAKETDGDLYKAFQLWGELKQQQKRGEVRITAERVKGICT